MTYAPDTIKAARRFYIDTLRGAGYTIDPLAVGIVGDDAHGKTGTSYHLGRDALKATAYSIVESSRDRAGLTDAAAALDHGMFDITVRGKRHDLRSFSLWLVAQAKAGTADTADIREIIYSPDGKTVKRWDRLGKRTTGDASHLEHTHVSWFRDSEGRDKTAYLRRYFTEIGALEDDMDLTADNLKAIAAAVWNQLEEDPYDTATPKRKVRTGTWLRFVPSLSAVRLVDAHLVPIAAGTAKILENVQADDGDAEQILTALALTSTETADATATAVLARLGGEGQSDDEIAAALRAALGDRAAAVGALLSAA